MKRKTENVIKGAIGETLIEELFKELGFFVMKLGKEHTVSPLDQLQDFIKSCKGEFKLEKLDFGEIKEVTHINVLPDLVIVSPNGKVDLLEVKFRYNSKLYKKDVLVFYTYPEAHMLIINLEVDDEIIEVNDKRDKRGLEILKKSRFHVWIKEDDIDKDTICTSPTILSKWLKEEFDVENDELIEKYEKLVERWLGNKNN